MELCLLRFICKQTDLASTSPFQSDFVCRFYGEFLFWAGCESCCRRLVFSCPAFLCSGNVQHRIVQDGHIKSLVDSLDPNHDPVSFKLLFIFTIMSTRKKISALLQQSQIYDSIQETEAAFPFVL